MIRALGGRILAQMLPVEFGPNALNLTLIDKKKHFDHPTRRARVVSVGDRIRDVKVNDVIVIRGDAGFTMDGDPEVDRAVYGEDYRWLKASEVEAVEERSEVLA